MNPLWLFVPIIVVFAACATWTYFDSTHKEWVDNEIAWVRYRFGQEGSWDRMCKYMAAGLACKTPEQKELVVRAHREVCEQIHREGEELGVHDERGNLRDWQHPCWQALRQRLERVPRKYRIPRADFSGPTFNVSEGLNPLVWDSRNREPS